MNNEIAKTEKNEIATTPTGAWGAGEGVTQEDLVIGKILIMQPQSRAVIKQRAKQGELRGSLDEKLYGDTKTGVDVIIFNQDKVWITYEDDEWKATEQWTPANAKWEWKEMRGAVKITRQKAFNFFCLVKDKTIESNLPVIVRMKSTSYSTGRKISTLFAQLSQQGKPSASRVLTLTPRQEENDQGVFYVWDFAEKGEASAEDLATAYKWYVGMKAGQLKVDESEETTKEEGKEVNDEVDFI